jgi:hypothetical protein
MLKFSYGVSTIIGPLEGDIFFCKVSQGANDVGISFHERAIVAKRPQCGAHFMDILQFFLPVIEPVDLCGVNSDLTAFNLYSQVVDFPLMEQALS